MESAGKRKRRMKTNLDFVPTPSDESDVNDEDMISYNSISTTTMTEKDPIEVEMETNYDSSSGSNLTNLNQLIAAQIIKLNNVDLDERLFRKKQYKIFNVIFRKRLHCTMCDIHIGFHYGQRFNQLQHPLLKVLACSECLIDYNKVQFKLSPAGQDQFCRWCGNAPTEKVPLRYCRACPFAFCEACIYYNLSITQTIKTNSWLCVVCNMKEIWPLRSLFSSLVAHSNFNLSRTDDKQQAKGTDLSKCCISETTPAEVAIVAEATPSDIDSDNIVTDVEIDRKVEPKSTSSYIPLPASKMESKWMKLKIKEISRLLESLCRNLNRVADDSPDIDDKFIMKSRLISLQSLLTIGRNQLNTYSTDLQLMWEKFDEEKRHTLCVNSKGIDDQEKTNVNPQTGLPESQIEDFYKFKYKTKPCSVTLIKLNL